MSENEKENKIHQIQISDMEMYAFEPLLCDAVHGYKLEIAELRRFVNLPETDTVSSLSRIQSLEGRIAILEDILEQLDLL